MNSSEMRRLAELIEANAAANTPRLREEMMRYMRDNEDAVVDELRSKGVAAIRTSFGIIDLKLSALLAAVA